MRLLCLFVLVMVVGCGGPPPPSVYNDHLFDAIQGAITNKDPYWLDQYSNRARACRDTGQLTEEQYRGLEAVFKKARAGDWLGAEHDVEAVRRQNAEPARQQPG